MLVIWLLWYFIKYATFMAIGYTLLLLLLQTLFSRWFVHLRFAFQPLFELFYIIRFIGQKF